MDKISLRDIKEGSAFKIDITRKEAVGLVRGFYDLLTSFVLRFGSGTVCKMEYNQKGLIIVTCSSKGLSFTANYSDSTMFMGYKGFVLVK